MLLGNSLDNPERFKQLLDQAVLNKTLILDTKKDYQNLLDTVSEYNLARSNKFDSPASLERLKAAKEINQAYGVKPNYATPLDKAISKFNVALTLGDADLIDKTLSDLDKLNLDETALIKAGLDPRIAKLLIKKDLTPDESVLLNRLAPSK
jgi:hypothetical protein